ncbi:MAG: ribonuclease Z [Actinomycetota bacterium]|nr:ribonuclease Z [Actinomycetota bacterium]
MTARELVVLGTASQVPTRTRNHNGYVLRWDDQTLLFDPGEGTQRQMTYTGVSASSLTRICVTHAHGDHCLGLPGVLQRLSLDRSPRSVDLHYPASAQPHIDALRQASAYVDTAAVHNRPVQRAGVVAEAPTWTLATQPLAHRIDAVGYRLAERDTVRMLPERLESYGVHGPDVGRLVREGETTVDGRTVRLDQVSVPRHGQVFAFVMDTAWCEGAVELARGADLLVVESTFLDCDRALAEDYGHLTARQAGRLAREAGARRLVLTHFSQRYGEDVAVFAEEAATEFADVVAARDLDRVPVPARR